MAKIINYFQYSLSIPKFLYFLPLFYSSYSIYRCPLNRLFFGKMIGIMMNNVYFCIGVNQ